MLKIIMADGAREWKLLEQMKAREMEAGIQITRAAGEIMEAVRQKGYEAVEEYSMRFDGAKLREIPKEEWEDAALHLPEALRCALKKAERNLRDYHSRLLREGGMWPSPDGGKVGRLVRPMHRVGIYVPGGTAAYPSTVLMNGVPAKVAGVEEVIMVTPPTANLSAPVLAAAYFAGVDRIFALGGVQAVAALTYGAGPIPKVDKLVGPGNAYVAAAKRMAYGAVDIDMVAGPSEVLIIADETANPVYVAADLLSQAEHDKMASAILLTDSLKLAQAVEKEIVRQAGTLSRREIIEASLKDYGAAIVCTSLDQAAGIANEIAPEHLELMTAEPEALLKEIKNAGAVFLGAYSPEPLGDYMAGPDHVLPTSGTARFFSPLSAESFLKSTSVIAYDAAALECVQKDIVALAQSEGLTAHANAVQVRFEQAK